MEYYSTKILDLFNNPKYVFTNNAYNFSSSAGDLNIGEYVSLYCNITIDKNNILNSMIKDCTFSAIGSAMLIASAEYLCKIIINTSITQALEQCNPKNEDGLYSLIIMHGKEHSFNFVLQAFYEVIQKITNYG